MKKLFICAVLAFFVLTTPLALAADTIKIAVIMAKTGYAAPDDILGFEAARFAADEINQQGGLLGKTVELIEFDNKSTALGSRQAAKNAVAAGVAAVVGADWSSHSLAIAPLFQDAKIPMVSPSSTNPKVTRVGDYIFRVCFTDTFQGLVMAKFALDHLKAKTAVVLTNANQEYSMGLARFFIKHFEQGGKILFEGDYAEGTTDFSTLLKKVNTLSPDIVFVPGYVRDSGYIIKQARKMGLKMTFLGGDSWDKSMYLYAGRAMDGNYFSDHWHWGAPNNISRTFLKKYKKERKEISSDVIPLTYDAFSVIADAVLRANSLDPVLLRDAIAATKDFMGVTGNLTFDEHGDPIKSAVVLKFENNDTVFFKTVEP